MQDAAVDAPVMEVVKPGGQAVQLAALVAAGVSPYVPMSHAMQAADDVAPDDGL